MRRRTRIAVAGAAAVLAVGAGGSAVVAAGDGDDEPDTAITGAALDKAEQAALAAVGPGVVTGTEVDDEESKYEVEVTLDSGGEVDVQLDAGFQVVGRANDGLEDKSED